MSIRSAGEVKISNMRSKTIKADSAEKLDKALNEWLAANSERNIVSLDTHGEQYNCWVVILYRE
jgi:hypothetical protein